MLAIYVFPYEVNPDIEIVIKGQFPYARYMSFTLAAQLGQCHSYSS